MDFLNFNSVENVPGIEARATFTVYSATEFTPVGRGCFTIRRFLYANSLWLVETKFDNFNQPHSASLCPEKASLTCRLPLSSKAKINLYEPPFNGSPNQRVVVVFYSDAKREGWLLLNFPKIFSVIFVQM